MVKYCNRDCQIAHRPQHKKECKKRAAELHDEELFKQPPSNEDCPICFLRMPTIYAGYKYMACCGNIICSGCVYAPRYDDQGNLVDNDKQNECPFCRVVAHKSNEEYLKRLTNRVQADDPLGVFNLGGCYAQGACGYPVDYTKALKLYQRAAELGYAGAYDNIGIAYDNGIGVEVDKKKGNYYRELGARGGDYIARKNLGIGERNRGNIQRALKHFTIAVQSGDPNSLDCIKQMYSNGDATKEDYTKALQSYQEYLGEIKSDQRDKAAAADEKYRYY